MLLSEAGDTALEPLEAEIGVWLATSAVKTSGKHNAETRSSLRTQNVFKDISSLGVVSIS